MANFGTNVLRETIQAHFLADLFSGAVHGELTLKGGMALRLGLGSIRQTKDIDLAANPRVPVLRVQKAVRAAIDRLKSGGLISNVIVTEPKQTETTLRWKINGFAGKTPIALTVEISRRDAIPADRIVTREAQLRPGITTMVEMLDERGIAATKMACLLDANREEPRDLYDLNLLITLGWQPPAEAIAELKRFAQGRDLSAVLWAKLEKINWDRVRADLLPYVPDDIATTFTESDWDEMRLTVANAVDRWLSAPETSQPPGSMSISDESVLHI